MSKPLRVFVAGSTEHTTQCASALAQDTRFCITGILTPVPKPIGRKQTLIPNPLHTFGTAHDIPVILVERKIDATVQAACTALERPDFLLVVDFGYIVPNSLLEWPTVAPINIHPSLLPRWRGSSPGQFVLLYGEEHTAVTIMTMDSGLDTGACIVQHPFKTEATWTAADYYRQSFAIATNILPHTLATYAEHPQATPQPATTPTPIATRLRKQDGYIPWEVVRAAQEGRTSPTTSLELSPVLSAALRHHGTITQLLTHAIRAFSPWPGVWTTIPTATGEKRLKLIEAHAVDSTLVLDCIQLEGKQPVPGTTLSQYTTEK